jgi:hypothetical protein
MLFTATAFTAGNVKIQVAERKHVINRALWVACSSLLGMTCQPYTRCVAALPFVSSYTEANETTEEASSVIVRRWTNHMTPRIHPSI